MRKIGIDARLYFQTGVGVYIRNLIHYLQKMELKETFYIYLMDEDRKKISFKNKNFIVRHVPYAWHGLGEQTGFCKKLLEDNLDLMHFTYFSYPILYRDKFIATVHDLTPLLFKTGRASTKNSLYYQIKYFFFQQVLKSQINNARLLITPTQAVKNQIVKIYGSKFEKKIYPVYEGVNYELMTVKPSQSLKTKFNKDFFIYVGNFYPHKNVSRLVEAFSRVKKDINLILIGPNDYFCQGIRELIVKLNQQKRVIIYDKASLADLSFFYQNAKALIHPSMSEGFGLPLIEALYFKLAVIASNIPVFKEILDGQYLSLDPYDVDDISDKINRFLEKKPLFNTNHLINRYSFEKMAGEVYSLYTTLL